jgi:hypothetical protein
MMVTDTDLLQEYDYLRYLRIQNVDTTPALVAMAIASLIAGTNRYKPSEDFLTWYARGIFRVRRYEAADTFRTMANIQL